MLAAAQVIDAVAARISGATAAGTNVFTSRTWPLSEDMLPAWRVVAGDEPIDPEALGQRIGRHQLEVLALGYVRAINDLDDAMHALAAAALPAIFADPIPYGMQHVGIGRETSTEGEAAVGVITLRLSALYYTNPAEPETILSS